MPPKPLSRVIAYCSVDTCVDCGSTMNRNGFLGLFGKLLCDNLDCPNSISKIKNK